MAGYYGFTLVVRVSIRLSVHPSVCRSIGRTSVRPSVHPFYTPPHNSGRVLWFHVGRPCVHLSVRSSVVRPSIFRFRMITSVNINGFSPNSVCALILWRSGLGLLMGKFRQFLTELSARDTPIFSFPDNNFSK